MPPMSRAPVLRTCLTASVLVAVAAATTALTAACSAITKVDYAECEVSADCRAAFGHASVCGEGGLCETARLDARCKKVFPEDLFSAPEKYPDAVILGSLLDHNKETGDLLMIQAASLAVEGANKSGLTAGRQFGIVHCDYQEFDNDSKTSEDAAIDGARYLVDQLGAVAIVGPGTSGLAEVVFRELQKPEHAPQALIVSPSATSVSLTNIDVRDGDKPGLFWRTAPPDSQIGAELAGRMIAEGITTATVIYESGSYGEGLALALQTGYEGQPSEPALLSFTTADDIGPLVAQVGGGTPGEGVGVVFIGSEVPQVNEFLNRASVYPFYEGVTIFLGDTAKAAGVLEGTAGAANLYPHIRGVFPGTPDGPVFKTFRADYKAAFGPEPDSFAALTYDATWLAIYGTAWAEFQRGGSLTGLDLGYGLQRVSDAKGLPVDVIRGSWTTVKAEFKAGRSINITGVSGNLDYDPETEECTAPFSYWKIKADGTGFEDLP
jgi:branched-chain amino acid transport system substrate-binding protein